MSATRWILVSSTVVFVAAIGACQETPTEPDTAAFGKPAPVIEKSNGAPSGKHYNLNIIGVPKAKSATMDGNNGHRIFVPEDGKAKIISDNLCDGFGVCLSECPQGAITIEKREADLDLSTLRVALAAGGPTPRPG